MIKQTLKYNFTWQDAKSTKFLRMSKRENSFKVVKIFIT